MAKSKQQIIEQARSLDAGLMLLRSTRVSSQQFGPYIVPADVATALWAVSRRIMHAQNVTRLTEPWLQLRKSTHSKRSRNDKNLVGPRILYLGPRRVTAHIHIPSTGIKWTEHVPWLVRHRFRRWKFRLRI